MQSGATYAYSTATDPRLSFSFTGQPGQEAVDQIEQLKPDVVVLDVEMPYLDGISTLPLLLEKKRDLVVIMASALTRAHAETTLKALSLGAADYVPKPEAEGGILLVDGGAQTIAHG